MASDRQVSALCGLLRKNDYAFSAEARCQLHELVKETRIRPPIPGYVTEVDGHPLSVRTLWPGLDYIFDAHIVSVAAMKPFVMRSMHLTLGKPTSYSLARAVRSSILEPCGISALASAPALVLFDGEPICQTPQLFDFIAGCGSRRIIAKKGAPHAKPHVEGGGGMLQRAANYSFEFLFDPMDENSPDHTLALPAEQLARAYLNSLNFVNETRLEAWVKGMHNCALGLRAGQRAEIEALRWPVVVTLREGMAKLDSGETYSSESIADLEEGIYRATRSLDPYEDDLRITIEEELVAHGVRRHAYPEELRPYQHFLEAPRR